MLERVLINVALFLFAIVYYKKVRHGMHMLQLESYFNIRYFKWIKNNIKQVIRIKQLILLVIPIVLVFAKQELAGLVLELLAFAVIAFVTKKKQEKKPFVVTARVKRMFITHFLLFAVIAVLVNIIYIPVALIVINVVVFISYFMVIAVNTINSPVENAIKHKFIKQAKHKLQEVPRLQVLGITGSYGKTSTKYAINTVLSQKYNTLMTPESYNTTMGVVRTINEKLNPTHQLFICEMGAKNIGDIKEITDIVKPTFGLLTAIGPQHLDTFKTVENVAKTKLELVDSLPKNSGIAFINWEDENVRKAKIDKKTVKYGLSNEADYWAENIEVNERGTSFDVVMPDNQKIHIKTKLLGKLNILNIVAAVAVGDKLGLTKEEIQAGCRFLKSVPHRLAMAQNPNGSIIIDDAYNSNTKGAEMALEVLKSFKNKKRILITPGIVDLGSKTDEINSKLGEQAAESSDFVILVGAKQAVPILKGLQNKHYPQSKTFIAQNLNEALRKMNEVMDSNSVILLENDLPDNYL